MKLRLLHTADWQLGKSFEGFDRDAGRRLADQRLATVRRLAKLAAERSADAVLVAGDVFEHQSVSPATLTGALGAMREFAGPWVLLPGNHDYAGPGSVWERVRELRPAANIHLATTPAPLLLCDGGLAVLPAPLLRRHEAGDLTAGWNAWETPAGALRVGLAHGSVQGVLPEPAEAHNPIAPDRAEHAGLAYLALGDWHGTFEAGPRAYYSGTPEPDRFKRNDSGSVLLVELAPGAAPAVTPEPLGRFTWAALDETLTGGGDIEALDRRLAGLLPADRHVVRLDLSGRLSLPELAALQRRIEWWQGQFAVLEVRCGSLGTSAAAGDFAALAPPGFVNDTIAELQRRAADPAQSEAAGEALRILYGICTGEAANA